MAFTKKEYEQWHKEKQKREHRDTVVWQEKPIAICIHCHQPFGVSEGQVTADVAICYRCAD